MAKQHNKTAEANIGRLTKEIEKALTKVVGKDATLRYQIEQLASDIVIMRMIRKELLALSSMMIEAEGSQGQTRTMVNPLSTEYREYGRRVQDGLDKLRMNRKSKAEKAGVPDPLADWMKDND